MGIRFKSADRVQRSAGFYICAVLLVTIPVCAPGLPSWAADMTAREVVRSLFAATATTPADLTGKDLHDLDLSDVDFKAARLTRVNLQGSDLSHADLARARLDQARLDRATLIGTNFTGADLTGATLLRPNLFADMKETSSSLPRFNGANMTGAHLNGRFDGVDFSGAILVDTFFGPRDPRTEELITPMMEMRGCNFANAVMRGADLSRNALENAKFTAADLTAANLQRANLSGADFSGADITGADFSGATIAGATFANVRGRDSAKGLDVPAAQP